MKIEDRATRIPIAKHNNCDTYRNDTLYPQTARLFVTETAGTEQLICIKLTYRVNIYTIVYLYGC